MGIDQDRFVDVSAELICCICTGVLEDPIESPCRHVFCSDCISRWLRNQSTCPNCRRNVRKNNIKPALPLIKNIISKLKINCDYAARGCKVVVALESLKSHCKSCQFSPVKCPHKGCNREVSKRDLDLHKASCPKRVLVCPEGCGTEVVFAELNGHNCMKDLKKIVDEQSKQLVSQEKRIKSLESQVKDLKTTIDRIEQRHQSPQSSPTHSPRSQHRDSLSPDMRARYQGGRRNRNCVLSSQSRSRSRSRSPISVGSPSDSNSSQSTSYRRSSPYSPLYSSPPAHIPESPYSSNDENDHPFGYQSDDTY